MLNEEPHARRFYAVSYNDDEPTISLGMLIPRKVTKTDGATEGLLPERNSLTGIQTPYAKIKIVTVIVAIAVFAFVGMTKPSYLDTAGARFVASLVGTTAPAGAPVVVQNPYTNKETPLNYGVQMTFTEPSFFLETRESYIASERTFIEVDLTSMELRYFEDGVLREQMPILSKGKKGSWWETPAGLYKVESKKARHFSSFGQVYTPWNLVFQGNFSIHGWPEFPDGTRVPEDFSGGCVRLSDTDAERIYSLVDSETPILVHEEPIVIDGFVYEPKIPELDTPHYLIADVESSTVLASSELGEKAAIASLTKLMTALVAAEYINLDTSVFVDQPTFVQSLVPRLGDRNVVSMYSLLQLLLVESSNEAAEVIAAQIGREQFIEHMNDKARALGLTDTVFTDPSGLSSENVSSLRDLLGLIRYIYNSRRFIIELTANQDLPSAYVSGEFGALSNFNKVGDLENFIGGKVGETTAAGQTSITLHRLTVKGQERVLAIILLGSDGRNADVRELLGYAEARFGY